MYDVYLLQTKSFYNDGAKLLKNISNSKTFAKKVKKMP